MIRSLFIKGTEITNCLSAKAEASLGPVQVLGEGVDGHRQLTEVFFQLLALIRPSTFCDIGANKGEVGQRAAKLLVSSRVYGFEANPEIFEEYRKSNVCMGVHWKNLAVSDRTGPVDLIIPRVLERALVGDRLIRKQTIENKNTGKSSLLVRDENAKSDTMKIQSVTLDYFFLEEGAREDDSFVLWIDVEGAASMVLDGAQETLAKTKMLMIEVEGHSFWKSQVLVSDLIDRLQEIDFVPCFRDREYGDAQFNIIFLHSSVGCHVNLKRELTQSPPDQTTQYISQATPSRGGLSTRDTPVLVPCFNNPSYCESTFIQLVALGFADITFVDNNSDSEMMLNWLNKVRQLGVRVENLRMNLGPVDSIFTRERIADLPPWFCVTDPDLLYNPLLPKNFLSLMKAEALKYKAPKVGFALNVSDRRRLDPRKYRIGNGLYGVREWEEQFWDKRLGFTPDGDAVFSASVDTTFALYNKERFQLKNFLKAIRIAGNFVADHKPWLLEGKINSEEAEYYRLTQRFSFYSEAPKTQVLNSAPR